MEFWVSPEGVVVNVMDSGAILEGDTGLCIGTILWALLQSSHRIHVLLAYQRY